MKAVSIAFWMILALSNLYAQVPLPMGHSHNDYERERPLLEAFELGFTSIEADIHPFLGQLKVSHDKKKLWHKPNLKNLYIAPLDSIVDYNGGTVFPNDSTVLTLMIDLKTKKEIALRRLNRLAKRYSHLFYKREKGVDTWGPIRIVISGNPPPGLLTRLSSPYLFIDGRMGEEYPDFVKSMVCRISANYNSLKDTNGNIKSFAYIATMVQACTDNGKTFRFWATKDNPKMWDYLKQLGVTWIGVDDLDSFASYIRNEEPTTASSK